MTIKIADCLDLPPLRELTPEQWAEHDAKVAAERASEAAYEETQRIAELRANMLAGGCRVAALEAVFDREIDMTSQAMVHVASCKPPGIFCLGGGVGCGKTVAATWWLKQWAKGWPRLPKFITAERFGSRGHYDREFRDSWERASALVLDDLGAEYGDKGGQFLVMLDGLIDHAYGERVGLMITTNMTGQAFKSRYGERIVSRIKEHGGFFACGDGDRRIGK